MRVAITDRFALSAKSHSAQTDYFDEKTPGLALRVSSSGKKVWNFVFTSPQSSKRARLTLGSYPSVSLGAARALAIEARGYLDEVPPRDPRDALPGASAAMTVAMLVDSYLEKKVRADGLRSAHEIELRLRNNVLPIIGSVPLTELHRRDVTRVTDIILKRGSPVAANRVFSYLRAMFRWAVSRGDLDSNPIDAMTKPSVETARDRMLSDDEIRTLWNRLPEAIPFSTSVQRIIRLCLVTGQRVGEVAGMRRAELDLKRALWTLPGSRTKNASAHSVPLSSMALEILREALADITEDAEHIFPATGRGPSLPHLDAHAVTKTLRAALNPSKAPPKGRLGMDHWTPHDLRRTVFTNMAKLGIEPIVIGAVANHLSVTKATVTFAVYVQHDYAREKRVALELWAERLAAIVTGADTAEILQMNKGV